MKKFYTAIFLGFSIFVQSVFASSDPIDFQLKTVVGKQVQLQKDYGDSRAIVVAFIGTECPLVKLYASRLNELAQTYDSKSVAFIGINSNRHDTIEEVATFAKRHNVDFDVLKDPGNKIADLFGAERTPEVFVLNNKFEIVYQGVIDDQYTYGVQQAKAKNHYLRDALDAIVKNETIAIAKTEAVGCIIGRQLTSSPTSDITFHNQISRIFQNKCVRCHRSGELAPFALEDHDEVAGWAGMIEEVVREKRMPPWHADAEPGHFKNDARLTEDEKNLIFKWVEAGAPAGDIADAPAKIKFADGWQIGVPDQIIKMRNRPFRVPATGTVEYKYFRVDPKFTEDKWIKAAECRPGNRGVVHHIIVGVQGKGEFGDNHGEEALESEWIAATAPGAPPMVLPDGYAKFVPAGSKLIFQMHYTPNGTKQSDLSEIGLVFAKPDEVKKRVMTLMSFNSRLKIPPGDDDYRITSRYTLGEDVQLMSMFPHMHYRGKSFRFDFKLPGQGYEIFLDVPNYDFNWQNAYELGHYVNLPKGTKLRCIAKFDNSDDNLANPDPTRTVRWGDQTWEEMMIGYFDVAVDTHPKQ